MRDLHIYDEAEATDQCGIIHRKAQAAGMAKNKRAEGVRSGGMLQARLDGMDPDEGVLRNRKEFCFSLMRNATSQIAWDASVFQK